MHPIIMTLYIYISLHTQDNIIVRCVYIYMHRISRITYFHRLFIDIFSIDMAQDIRQESKQLQQFSFQHLRLGMLQSKGFNQCQTDSIQLVEIKAKYVVPSAALNKKCCAQLCLLVYWRGVKATPFLGLIRYPLLGRLRRNHLDYPWKTVFDQHKSTIIHTKYHKLQIYFLGTK